MFYINVKNKHITFVQISNVFFICLNEENQRKTRGSRFMSWFVHYNYDLTV